MQIMFITRTFCTMSRHASASALLFVLVAGAGASALASAPCAGPGRPSPGPRPTPATVTSPAGTFLGSTLASRRGRTIYSFRGIRYAEPPVGELRFKPPKLIERYEGAVDAREDGPACPQPSFNFFNTSEDCLRLNVYSPQHTQRRDPLPVLVYIHPGGFYSVSGQSTIAGPQYLLDHDVVLVTINYRLGSLGFLSTGDSFAPGNNGYKDQVAALRWIQRNIRAFGGDPAAVTVCGYSAGSFSVILHMLSPMSKGLIHGAIAMSGSPMAQWEVPHHQRDLAEKQARILNCPTTSSEEIITCLKTKSWNELGDSLPKFFEFNNDPVLLWKPVVEPDVGQERFLGTAPAALVRAGSFANDVPLILGMSELEFAGQAFSVLSNESLRTTMESEWDRIAPISFVFDRRPPKSVEISQRLKQFYLGDRQFVYDNDTAFALGRLYSDGLISYGVHKASRLMSEHLSSPVYYYKFNYTGTVSHAYYPGTQTPLGAVHHDDLIYLFQGAALFPIIGLDSPHSLMVDKMTTMWTNFATRGDPNPAGEQPALGALRWARLRAGARRYLQINQDSFRMLSHMYEDRFRLWEELFPAEP